LAAKAGYMHTNALRDERKGAFAFRKSLEEFLKSTWFAPRIGLVQSIGGTVIFLEFPKAQTASTITG
jgi:hypothetical protein